MSPTRRDFLQAGMALGAAGTLLRAQTSAAESPAAIVIDPQPRPEISPWLYMQFMEPLGTTDASVEAAWDYDKDDWRADVIAATRDLAPGMVRYGGIFSRYYKWREGVGPAAARPMMRNYEWGGKETNRVGTHEFVDFCRRVGAEPLYCVNFLSDGRRRYWDTPEGNRSGDAQEAADWVSYANDPDNRERRAHGHAEPYGIKLWQLGNETSYGTDGFTKDECIEQTIAFAKAMRARDPAIKLIGWGDWSRGVDSELWAGDLVKRAGEHLDYVAIHLMGQRPTRRDTVLDGLRYQAAPEQAWQELLELSDNIEQKVSALEAVLDAHRSPAGIAVTEGHFSLRPRNMNPILLEWLSGVFHARTMNIYQRHAARVKIATAADFCGTRWTVNALMIQVPRGKSYLTPAGAVMRLFQRVNGRQGVSIQKSPTSLDIAASRTADRIFLHVANLDYARAVEADLSVAGMAIRSARVHEIATDSIRTTVSEDAPDALAPREHVVRAAPGLRWRFPAGSVSAVELECAPA